MAVENSDKKPKKSNSGASRGMSNQGILRILDKLEELQQKTARIETVDEKLNIYAQNNKSHFDTLNDRLSKFESHTKNQLEAIKTKIDISQEKDSKLEADIKIVENKIHAIDPTVKINSIEENVVKIIESRDKKIEAHDERLRKLENLVEQGKGAKSLAGALWAVAGTLILFVIFSAFSMAFKGE